MPTTTHPWQGGSSDPAPPLPSLDVDGGASTDASLIGSTSDTCSHCGALMASDQRYCVNCGERRGKPRFTVAAAAAAPTTREAPKRAPRRSRQMTASAGTTLIAGVATLLLALGVGVLIGQDNKGTTAAKTTIITVGNNAPTGSSGATGTGTGAAQTSTPATSSTQASTSATGSKGAKGSTASTSAGAKSAPVSTTKATSAAGQQAAANGASKVLGGANVGSPTAQPGSSCTAGTPGCQGGKQTGQLFGGG
jgi:hypothetical protein